jgi:hypothetical protein
MYNLTQFIEQQRRALEAGDINKAIQLLSVVETYTMKRKTWHSLKYNEPESYAELYFKLGAGFAVLRSTGKYTLQHLLRFFRWCENHDIALEDLAVSQNLYKYRDITAYLISTINRDADIADIKQDVLDVINRIKADKNRDETRSWARGNRDT